MKGLLIVVVLVGTALLVSGAPITKRLNRNRPQPATPPTAQQLAAMYRPAKDGIAFVSKFDKGLTLTADRLKARHALQASDPFLFFRANPALFHWDTATHAGHKARSLLNPATKSPELTIGGDIHLANFGTFRAPSGDAVFGINDYDQAGKGTADADLTRLATSIVLAARSNKFKQTDETNLVDRLVREYFEEVHELTKDGPKSPWVAADKAKGKVKALIEEATAQKRGEFLDKYTIGSGTKRKFKPGTDLVMTNTKLMEGANSALRSKISKTLPYNVLDVAERLNAGGSSFGLPRVWLLVNNPKGNDKEPVIVEIKAFLPPGLSHGNKPADGPALLAAQKLMGALVNPITDVTDFVTVAKKWFLIREIEPEKDSLKLETLKADDMAEVVAQCAKVLARAHSAGGQPAIAAKIDAWVPPAGVAAASARLQAFATTYATQVTNDHEAYKASA